MYHRFNENKYPSTNIQMSIFKSQIDIINYNNFKFYNPDKFEIEFNKPKTEKKFLLTIDDAFASFYENACPYLKENKIPFILFVSTDAIGKFGYMTWSQIKEIEKEEFVFLGNHSHSHEYLISYNFKDFQHFLTHLSPDDYPYRYDISFNDDNLDLRDDTYANNAFALYLKKDNKIIATYAAKELGFSYFVNDFIEFTSDEKAEFSKDFSKKNV